MNNTSIFKVFLKYISLNILGQMAYSCYTLADTFFVSAKLGTSGLAALNLAFPPFCIISGVGLMIGIGGGTGYAITKTRGEDRNADRVFTNAVYLAAAFILVFVLAGLLAAGAIAKFLGADSTVFPMTKAYLQIILLCAPAFITNNLLQCFVRNDGNPTLSAAAMITGSASNIVLDYLFIFPLDMGIAGAALATGLAPLISLLVLSPYFIRKKNNFHFVISAPDFKSMKRTLSSGVPPFLTETTSGVVMFLFNYIILRLTGNTGVAAFSIITVISLVVVAIYTGLSQGIQPVISRSYGARNILEVRAVLKYAMAAMLILSAVIYSVLYFDTAPIVDIFNSDGNEKLRQLAEAGLRLYFIACPFIGFNVVLSTYLISTERPVPAQIFSLLRGFFILIPAAFALAAVWNMTGVWCSYPLTECTVAAAGAVLYITNERKRLDSVLRQ